MAQFFSLGVESCDMPIPPTASPTSAPTVTPTPLPGTRDKTTWPFASTSIWNMPIGSGAVYVPSGITPRREIAVDDEFIVVTSSSGPVVPFYTNGIWGPGRCATLTHQYSIDMPANLRIADATQSYTPNDVAAFVAADGRTIHQMSPVARCSAGGALTTG